MGKKSPAEALKELQDIYAASREPMDDTPSNQLAVKLGWRWDGHFWFDPEGQLLRWAGEPDFDCDLEECRKAEARIIAMGLRDAYEHALMRELMGGRTFRSPSVLEAALASPEVRCRAMLAALESSHDR